MNKSFTDELKRMEDEFNKKYAEFVATGDSLSENIRNIRLQEIQSLRERTENFYQHAQQQVQQKQQELLIPIRKKITDAIKAVGDEQNYTYIFQEGNEMLYFSSGSIDATPLVKTKLGLK
jgi:Outer membrane protein